MLEQIESLPGLIRAVAGSYPAAASAALDARTCRAARRIYLMGCGDSHHAALGAELAFEQFTGLPTEALTALQFARYTARSVPEGSLVFGTSVSGEVSRTLEGLLTARKAGAETVALTANPAGRIGRAAEHMMNTAQPPFQDPSGLVIPGSRSFVANQVGLLLAALHIGEANGHLSSREAREQREQIAALGDAAGETIALNRETAAELAETWRDAQEYIFLGAGPGYAAALFSAAKVLEACGDAAQGQDTEEWAHLQYFARSAATPTFVISAGGRDLSRAAEVATAARQIGRRVAAVAPLSATVLTGQADRVLPLAEGLPEIYSPVISAIPASLFAARRADVIGEPFFRGFGGGRSPEGGGGISRIRTSQLLDGLEAD